MKHLQYIKRQHKKSHEGLCKIVGLPRDQLDKCFMQKIEFNLKNIRNSLPEKNVISIGGNTDLAAPMFLRFSILGLETDYSPKRVDWDKFALGLEYFFVGSKVKLSEHRLRFKIDRTKFLNPLAAAILAGRNDMIRFYHSCLSDGKPRKDDNFDLMTFIECILSGAPTTDCGVFSTNSEDDLSEKLEQILNDHHENSLFKKSVSRPFYMLPYNLFPVHVFLWLKHHNFKDQYGLHEFIHGFENMTYQHDELLLKIETEYAKPI